MNETLEFVVRHGTLLVFAAVFVEQLGVPLPAAPWLLAAGALAATGKINWFTAITAATLGSLLADTFWFCLGRYRGQRVLKFLCRMSLEPDSCVRRTQGVFTRYGMRGVVVAKFIPGLSTLAPALAGSAGIRAARYFPFDGLGSLMYAGCFILLGIVFSNQLEQIIGALAGLGHSALVFVIGLVSAYIGYKYWQRRRLLNELKTARITVDELHQKLETGDNPVILDLRSLAEIELNPLLIRGARHMTMEDVEVRHHEIPRDREIVLYCS